jgi:O-antigen ligase
MPPKVALIGCLIIIGTIIYLFDKKEKREVSWALFLPLIWMCVIGSRNISQFLDPGGGDTQDVYFDGSPIDRWFYTIIIIIGIIVLLRRKISLVEIIRQNIWIFAFFAYCGFSLSWSDYPYVSIKRFIKNIGNIVMVLIVISDSNPKYAFRLLFKWFSYILLPLSVVLYKYFSHIGRGYHRYTGELLITGVTNNKNALGTVCFISSMFFIWNLFLKKEDHDFDGKYEYYGSCIILLLSLYLLHKSNCSTADVCLVFGSLVLLLLRKKNEFISKIKASVYISGFLIVIFLTTAYQLNIHSLVDVTGHSDTFWGRVTLWSEFVDLSSGSIYFGEGYDSYWLGERLKILWDRYWWHPTEAHNGYVEIFLELGVVGLIMFFAVFRSCLNKLIYNMEKGEENSIIRFAFFITIMLYNIPESAVKGLHVMWFLFLLVTMEYRFTHSDIDYTERHGYVV